MCNERIPLKYQPDVPIEEKKYALNNERRNLSQQKREMIVWRREKAKARIMVVKAASQSRGDRRKPSRKT
jgi:hypothetical protein